MIQLIQETRRKRDSQSGFTLIELLVVITILGILSGIVVFAVQGVGDKGETAAFATDARTIRTAEEVYCGKNGRYGTEDELVAAQLLTAKSDYHAITLGGSGPCTGAGGVAGPQSAFGLTCDVTQAGCGAGGAITRGGTMVVAISGMTSTFNPAATSNGGVHGNSEAMFNGLTAWSPANTVVPDLAESWTTSPDARTWTFTLRPGMKWHNGTDITAEDVDFTFREALLRYHSRTASSLGPALGVIPAPYSVPAGAITMPDGPTGLKVQFNLLYPHAPLLRQLNVTEAPIIPKNVYAECSSLGTGAVKDTIGNNSAPFCPANQVPVGSGPFKFKAAETNSTQITVEANPAYYKPGLPYLGKIVYVVKTTAEADNALRAARGTSGSVDVAGVPGSSVAFYTGNSNYQLAATPRGTGGGNCITTLSFNLWPKGMTAATIVAKPANAPYEHPILKDRVVREAISRAFDRQSAFTTIDFSQGRLADSPYHSALDVHQVKALPTFDRAAAGAALEAAGWILNAGDTYRKSDGRPGLPAAGTELAIDNAGFDNGQQLDYITKFVADMLTIGIRVTPQPRTNSTQQTALATRNYDTSWISYCHGDAPVIGVRRAYHSSQITATAFVNVAGVREKVVTPGDGTMDDLWDRAAQASGATYNTLHNQIQNKAVADLPYMWMVETLNVRGYRSVCSGFNNQNTGLFVEEAYCQI